MNTFIFLLKLIYNFDIEQNTISYLYKMNRNLHSPSQLTEFSRDFDEEPETIFSKFVNRLTSAYNNNYNNINIHPPSLIISSSNSEGLVAVGQLSLARDDIPTTSQPLVTDMGDTGRGSINSLNNLVESDSSSDLENKIDCDEIINDEIMAENVSDRTPLSVLQRISNLVAQRSNNLHSYKDTELQKFWMPDDKSKECYECSVKFSTFRRKHHCRLCGQIFCSKCCNQVVPGKIIKCSDHLKVCTYCSKIVLSYLRSSDLNTDLKSDLQALKEDLSNKLSVNSGSHANLQEETSSNLYNLNEKRKFSIGYQEERLATITSMGLSNADRKSILQQSNSLKLLHEDMFKILPNQNRGIDLINYLIINHKSSNKIQAIAILNAMIDAGFLITLIQSPSEALSNEFDENYLYKLLRKDGNSATLANSNSFQLELNIESNSVQLSRPNYDCLPRRSTQFSVDDDIVQEMTNCQLENNLMSSAGSKPLLEGFCDHEETLLEQLLHTESLDASWNKILIQHCARVANTLRPELCGTQLMDIRHFVNFKKVPGGQRCESTIIGGVVFTKNVVHKEMATRIKNPRILLLQCAIVYQRVEGKLVRIETLLLQEKEYLRNVTARILSLKPNVVLVHKNVSGIAQDMLREHGITLVLDVKQSVLERLALNLQCDIVSSIDSNIGQPKLGICDLFYIKSFSDGNGVLKSLMFFETSSNPRGCCVLLRGGNTNELARVKRVASFLLFVRYNWRLELSFLLDEYARPPSPKPSIFDSKEQSPSDDLVLGQNEKLKQEPHQKSVAQLIKKSSVKKIEDKIISKENVQDFSDPLRAEDTSELNQIDIMTNLTVETPYDNRFRTALNSTILTISPSLTFPLPFLETEPGKKCSLRCHFPNEIFYSKQWSESSDKPVSHDNYLELDNIELLLEHGFIRHKIITPVDNREFQTLLANFRASGGRFPKKTRMKILTKTPNELYSNTPKKPIEEIVYQDALDIYNHQRLPVLFCSYYYNPKTASSFCAPPSLLNMSFYGQNDIMLGSFLERYCFRTSYICPSCNLLMLDHIRRYVHSNGCILVALSEESKKGEGTSEIHMYSLCSICQKQTKSVPMSKDTWCFSFAKYLELRFHGHAYKRRNIEDDDHICEHSLHRDYIQYFSYNGICASFEYSPVDTWEITLPSLIIKLKPPKAINKSQVIEEIKNFAMKGYEVYAKIYDKLALISSDDEHPMMATLKVLVNRDQMIFRSKVEKVHTVMTETGVTCYDISNVVFMMKRSLAESIEIWGPKLHEATLQSQQISLKPQKPENCYICTEELHAELGDQEENKRDLNDSTNSTENRDSLEEIMSGSEKSNPNLDKKGIRSLLSQLIPSTSNQNNSIPSPLPSNEYYTIQLGQFPVLIRDNDISSIIAYSLISNDYLKAIENLNSGYTSDTNNSPHLKRKSHDVNSGGSENTDQPKETGSVEKEKKSKSNTYLSINFQDLTTQFTCKIYFAKEFDQLRANFLKSPYDNTNTQDIPGDHSCFDRKLSNNSLNSGKGRDGNEIDEIRRSFVRSLCYSHFWEARGGKSGSKFSKTSDDHFILKEMSKQDVAIFENFAPNYFDYINQCLQVNQPTLLAKILGVFRVTIKKRDSVQDKSILVMENLFSDRQIANKFDLKGSERNRLVDPNNQNGEIVLLDENLIQMSWSKPLYILGHSRTILRQAINRDSSFLEKNGVMDYSLLVGLDKNEKLLVLGIIDYIRTYTLDKKLESLVKQSGLLGGQGKLPTIISPKLYKQRFIEAMDRYFLIVPDRWEGLGKK